MIGLAQSALLKRLAGLNALSPLTAACTSYETACPGSLRALRRWLPPRSARSSPSPTLSTSESGSSSSRPCSAGRSPRVA